MSRLEDFYLFLDTEKETARVIPGVFEDSNAAEDLFTTDEFTIATTSTDLTGSEEIVLYLLQLAAGTLSLIGSSAILYKIFRNLRKHNYTTPYERIILGLSCCDVISSLTYAIGPFLLPSDTSKRPWALGNDSTCTYLGFFNQLACFWAVWYNCLLSFYYLLTVRFGVKKKVFREKYELPMHLSGAIFFPLTATIGFFGGWYSEERYAMTCWIGEVPKNCSEDDCWVGVLVAYLFGAVPSIFTLLSVTINNLVIYIFVRRLLLSSSQKTSIQELRGDTLCSPPPIPEQFAAHEHAIPGNIKNENLDVENRVPLSGDDNILTTRLSRKQRLAKEAAVQGFLYVSCFLLTYTPASIIAVIEGNVENGKENLSRLYPLMVLNSMLLPLQGFFNVFIYVKPSYDRFRGANPKKSKWFILKKALFEKNIPKMNSVRDSSTSSLTISHLSATEKKYSEMRKQGGSNFSMSLENIAEENDNAEMDDASASENDTEENNAD